MTEVISAKEQERKLKAVAKEIKRVRLGELADYLRISRPSVDVITLTPATWRLFFDNREACLAQRPPIRHDGKSMFYEGYRLKLTEISNE